MEDVLEELQHAVHGKQVDAGADAERVERVTRDLKDACMQELVHAAASRAADACAAEEQARRMQQDRMDLVRAELHGRHEAQCAAAQQQREHTRMLAAAAHDAAMEGVVRAVDAARAKRLARGEQQRAVQRERFARVLQQLNSVHSAAHARRLEAAARIERVEAAKHLLDARVRLDEQQPKMRALHRALLRAFPRGPREAGVVPDRLAGRMDAVHAGLRAAVHRRSVVRASRRLMQEMRQRRRFARAMRHVLWRAERGAAVAAEEREREERVHSDRLHAALQDAVRVCSARDADAAMDAEARERTHVHVMRGVLEDAVRAANARRADAEAAVEQQRRVAELEEDGVQEVALMPAGLPAAVRTQLVRAVACRHVDAAMDEERACRVTSHRMFFVLQDLVRRVNQLAADRAMDTEQQQRSAVHRMRWTVLPELVSVLGRKRAGELERREQQRRVAAAAHRRAMLEMESAFDRRLCARLSAQEQERQVREDVPVHAFSALADIQADITAAAHRKEAAAGAAQEQARLVHRDRWLDVMTEVQRLRLLAGIRAAEERERARRVHEDRLCAVLEAAVRVVNRKRAAAATGAEQRRRVAAMAAATTCTAMAATTCTTRTTSSMPLLLLLSQLSSGDVGVRSMRREVHRELVATMALRHAAQAQDESEHRRMRGAQRAHVLAGVVREGKLHHVHRLEEQARAELADQHSHLTPQQTAAHGQLLTELHLRHATAPPAAPPAPAVLAM